MKVMYGHQVSLGKKPGIHVKCTSYRVKKGKIKKADKVDLACEVVRMKPGLDRLDLKKQVKKLVEFPRLKRHLWLGNYLTAILGKVLDIYKVV